MNKQQNHPSHQAVAQQTSSAKPNIEPPLASQQQPIRPKYVPIRPFRPLLPKPTPQATASPLTSFSQGANIINANSLAKSTSGKPKKSKSSKLTSTINDSKKLNDHDAPNEKKASLTANEKKTYKKRKNSTVANTTKKVCKSTKQSAASSSASTVNPIPVSVSPSSLITKRSKSSAGSAGLITTESLSPIHISLSNSASNLIMQQSSLLPSPQQSPSSSPSSSLDLLDITAATDSMKFLDDSSSGATSASDLVTASVNALSTPPLEDWASQTADEILAASSAEDFFWLTTPEEKSLTLNFDDVRSSVSSSSSSLDSMSSSISSLTSATTISSNLSDDLFGSEYSGESASNMKDQATTTNELMINKQPLKDDDSSSFEPFCSFDYSPEPAPADFIDPYGFLDLAISI